ncbi:MAG TPA: hypothetical protein VMT76_02715 [Puia sp.]|nr:hypothetical protein [Puia sp.]
MKIFLKYLLLLCISFFLGMMLLDNACAQDGNQKPDSLKIKIDSLQQWINDGSYTRIPNKDFDNIIENKIENSVRDSIRWWLFIVGGLISILSFLITWYAKFYLQGAIEKKFDDLRKDNDKTIEDITGKSISSVVYSLIDFRRDLIQKKDYKVDEASIDELKSYLTDERIKLDTRQKIDIIDDIMNCYYENPGLDDRNRKMIDLISCYDKEFTLRPETYANAAIAFLDSYRTFGVIDFLNSALQNCDKSINALPDYGLAFAIKIEAYLIAISNSFDETEKKKFEVGLLRVFKDIDNNKSNYLCKELTDRLKIDQKNLKPYLEKLYTDYADEIKRIEDRASVKPKANNSSAK